MVKAAVIFPGQGAQAVGMGQDIAEAFPTARALFEQANSIAGMDLAGTCFEGSAETLARTDVQQPAIFTVSMAIWAAYQEAGGETRRFDYAAGLSLGEYTALCAAGAVGFEDALGLVQRRGQLMQEAALAVPSGMVSLIGGDEVSARRLCEAAKGDEVLVPANFNCPGQVVISGNQAACERATQLAVDFGVRAIALAVAGAFHSPLMASAAKELRLVLRETSWTQPSAKVMANVNGEPHGDPDAIRSSLERQVTEPVYWQRCIERMVDEGVELFVEMGPGRVLTGLMRKINRKVAVLNVSTAQGVVDAVEKLRA